MILPCAGKGSRLGVPFPKELIPLGEGRLLIDSCLDLIDDAYENSQVRVILLEDGRREQTADYIRRKLPHIPLALVRQDEKCELPDGIMSLKPWLSPAANVVLLPDAVYHWDEYGYGMGNDPVTDVARKAMSYGFAFGVAQGPPEQIASMGALYVKDDRVIRYADKPGDAEDFNSFWVMLAFNGGKFGLQGMEQIRFGTFTKAEISVPPLACAPVTWIEGYRDCGTWENLEAEWGL